MKISLNKPIQEEIEIELPYYAEQGLYLYKIIDERNYIQVRAKDDSDTGLLDHSIAITTGYRMPIYQDHTRISEACFNNAFKKALSHINQQMFLGATTPATEQDKQDEEIFVNDLENVEI